MRKKFIAGNWKMFKTLNESLDFIIELNNKYNSLEKKIDIDIAILSNYIVLEKLIEISKGSDIKIGAQNMHFEGEGAFTGEISYKMLKSIGVNLTIIGHSERRQYFHETDENVNKKLKTCFENDIFPILCVGEALEIREKGEEKAFVKLQLEKDLSTIQKNDIEKLTIAYEPIWAIGTGKTASNEQAEEMCKFIRETVHEIYDEKTAEIVRIQYGGSVKPENAKEIFSMPNIDGGLIGGASLQVDSFISIIKSGNNY